MGIKYHQNGVSPEYGPDHTLTNNWNPEVDYGNEYVDIYFRIDAPYYQYPFTNYTQEQAQSFNDEVRAVFLLLGWKVDKERNNGGCMEMSNGKQHLYLHPQNFSGEVLKNDVKKIAEALENNETFTLRWVDLYKTVYDISDEEYTSYLETRKEEIRKALFEKCQTARSNKFFYLPDVTHALADVYRLPRIGTNDGKNSGSGMTAEYIEKIIRQMIEESYLVSVTDNDNTLIRSVNKTEQKKLKLIIA